MAPQSPALSIPHHSPPTSPPNARLTRSPSKAASKAAKVESAIEYIKQLKQEVSERDDLINKKDQEMDALKKELAALKRTGSEAATPEAAAQLKAEPSSSPNTENET
jgi:uncharacterized protein (DUF3084 family)